MKISSSLECTNIVIVWDLNRKIDIIPHHSNKKKLNCQLIREGKKCLLVFSSGKVVSTGFKSVQSSKEFIQRQFPDDKITLFKVSNVVAKAKLNYQLDHKALTQSKLKISYEPELLSAYHWWDNKKCLTYYTTGSIIITGGKSLPDCDATFKRFKLHTINCYKIK